MVFSAERAKEDQTRKERGTGEVAEAGGEEQKRGARANKGERGAVGEGRGGAEVSCELPLSQKGSKR